MIDAQIIYRLILTAATAFLLGSIPTSYLLGRFVYGVDPRDVGSGATGATNTTRAMGLVAGIITAFVDVAKGWVAIVLTRTLLAPSAQFGSTATSLAIGVALIAVIAGHAFSPWLRFRGGKGIAVAGGAIIALAPLIFVIELIALIAIAALSGYVALGSILIALALPVLMYLSPNTRDPFLVGAGVIAALFIVLLHRENIARLRAGTENHLTLGDSRGTKDSDETRKRG